MGDSSDNSVKLGDTDMIELTGKVMVLAIILLFFVIIFYFCLHLYAKWFWHRHEQNTTTTGRRNLGLGLGAGHQEIIVHVPLSHIGLHPHVLKNIPVVEYDPKEFKDGLECAVCLCEVSRGEKARTLPACNHGFHVECIDMWFQSHSTCPLCRNPVSMGEESDVDIYSAEAEAEAPMNVLFWGDDHTQVSTSGPNCIEENRHHLGSPIEEPSSSSSSSLVIEIPRAEEEQTEEAAARIRNLFRLIRQDPFSTL